MDTHVPRLRRVLLRLWNDAAWRRAERERHERELPEHSTMAEYPPESIQQDPAGAARGAR